MRILIVALLWACGTPPPAPAAPARAPGAWTPAERTQLARLRLDPDLPDDPTNRWSDDPAAVALGRALFYDPGLSASGRFSCATCHDPARHFTDGRALAEAAGITARHAPSIEGAQQGPWFFWDGRADSLWAQAIGPLEHPDEMDGDRVTTVRHVVASHRDPYEALFGPLPPIEGLPPRARPEPDAVDRTLHEAWQGLSDAERRGLTQVTVRVAKAIAAFERSVIPGEAPFDRYVDAVLAGDAAGGGHLSDQAVRGLDLFLRQGNCVACHNGPYFTDRAFHALGLPDPAGYDPGRTVGAVQVAKSPFRCDGPWSDADDCPELRFLNPAFEDFRGAFKTPTLRNVADTAPYMHRGQLADLDAVLDFYSELPGDVGLGHRELTLQPLGLTEDDKAALVAFLESLSAPVRPEALPAMASR